MSRFHFNVYDGISALDDEGTELADPQQARLRAIRLSGEILGDDYERLTADVDWHMEVTDETGLILYRLDFRVHDSSVLGQQRA